MSDTIRSSSTTGFSPKNQIKVWSDTLTDLCGRFEVRMAIGTAPDQHSCPECASASRRAFSPPLLSNVSRPLGTMLGRAEQSREAPEVIQRPSPLTGADSPVHPTLTRLPRP